MVYLFAGGNDIFQIIEKQSKVLPAVIREVRLRGRESWAPLFWNTILSSVATQLVCIVLTLL